MEFIYQDADVLICVKPAGVLSTDEPGGMPELIRAALGDPAANVRTVHRLDRVVSGLMVFARTRRSAAHLSGQIRTHQFTKEYLAVVHGRPQEAAGTLTDLLARCPKERKTYVVQQLGKGVQEAVLDYETVAEHAELTLVRIHLHTGRTHQIRAQFSARGLPLVGDQKYGRGGEDCAIALWSHRLCFAHPYTGAQMDVSLPPPDTYPWSLFRGDQG